MNILDNLLSFVAPNICVGCGDEGSVLCVDCLSSLSTVPSICYACGKATRAHRPCTDCVGRYHPQHVWFATTYENTAKKAVWALKLEQKRTASRQMALAMKNALPYFADPPVITYVPTAPSHRRERGFDHAELLAKELARLMGCNYISSLQRLSAVQQRGATRQQRKTQLKGVFKDINTSLWQYKHLLLVDDVVTTGSTLEECTAVLVKAGAANVDAAVFCRAE